MGVKMGLDDQFYKDMIESHSERMQNLMKYFPFFELQAQSLNLYKEGKYAFIDMAYVTMAVLRFFIEENHFHDRPVTYGQYTDFVIELLTRDFGLDTSRQEKKELASYIFDKLKNDGKPFSMEYFDPADKKKKTLRIKLIDSAFQEGGVVYTVTADAIAFYLDTKEIKEESKITMEQLLLEKMITNRNFKGGIEVIRRINSEVGRLRVRKQEVLRILSINVFEGVKALEEFNRTGIRWFEEEQNAFMKNKDLIAKALEKAQEARSGAVDMSASSNSVEMPASSNSVGMYASSNSVLTADEKYMEVYRDISRLETELQRAMLGHSRLLADCMELSRQADERIRGYKFSRLRNVFDFNDYLKRMMDLDDPSLLERIALPMFAPFIKKTLPLNNLSDLLSYPEEREEEPEMENESGMEEMYRFDDEIEEERIGGNYKAILRTLLDTLLTREKFDLETFNRILELKYFDDIFRNSDYYSFLVHICQKKEYDVEKVRSKPETFLEDSLIALLDESGGRYRGMRFRVDMSDPLREEGKKKGIEKESGSELRRDAGRNPGTEPGKNCGIGQEAEPEEELTIIRHEIAGPERDSEFVTSNLYFTRL